MRGMHQFTRWRGSMAACHSWADRMRRLRQESVSVSLMVTLYLSYYFQMHVPTFLPTIRIGCDFMAFIHPS